jgi:hypothetical protein
VCATFGMEIAVSITELEGDVVKAGFKFEETVVVAGRGNCASA